MNELNVHMLKCTDEECSKEIGVFQINRHCQYLMGGKRLSEVVRAGKGARTCNEMRKSKQLSICLKLKIFFSAFSKCKTNRNTFKWFHILDICQKKHIYCFLIYTYLIF